MRPKWRVNVNPSPVARKSLRDQAQLRDRNLESVFEVASPEAYCNSIKCRDSRDTIAFLEVLFVRRFIS